MAAPVCMRPTNHHKTEDNTLDSTELGWLLSERSRRFKSRPCQSWAVWSQPTPALSGFMYRAEVTWELVCRFDREQEQQGMPPCLAPCSEMFKAETGGGTGFCLRVK